MRDGAPSVASAWRQVMPDDPKICRMAETLLTEVAGVPDHDGCERGENLAAALKLRSNTMLS